MSRVNKTVYVDAIREVLSGFGGGPIRSKELVEEILKKGLVADSKSAYNTILKVARESAEFTTSHGKVSLASAASTSRVVETAFAGKAADTF